MPKNAVFEPVTPLEASVGHVLINFNLIGPRQNLPALVKKVCKKLPDSGSTITINGYQLIRRGNSVAVKIIEGERQYVTGTQRRRG